MTPHLPNRPADPPNPGILNNSNSTANIFLGGARKSWMVNVGRNTIIENHHNRSRPHRPPLTSPTITATNNNHNDNTTVTTISNQPNPSPATTETSPPTLASFSSEPANTARPTTLVAAEPSLAPSAPAAPSQAPCSGMRDSPRQLQENLVSFGNNRVNTSNLSNPDPPTQPTNHDAPAPPSQSLPGASTTNQVLTPSNPALPHPHPLSQRPPAPQIPQFMLQQQQQWYSSTAIPSLPSPDPTITSRFHPSPPSAIVRNVPGIPSPSVSTFPSPLNRGTATVLSPTQNASPVGTIVGPILLSNDLSGGATPPLRLNRGNSLTGHHPDLPPATVTTPTTPIAQPTFPTPNESAHNQNNGLYPVIDDAFFAQSKATLDYYVAVGRREMRLSETVERPRIQLLTKACVEKDLVYLVLHQIYCLSTFLPSEFTKLPGVTDKQTKGLETVRHLLVDNHRVSGDFLHWGVRFPSPIPIIIRCPQYQDALSKVCRILAEFTDKFFAFEQNVRSRGFPPLAEEVAVHFNIFSPSLHYNIFLCLCRRIPGANVEGKLREIFNHDQVYFQRRFVHQVPRQQVDSETDEIISAYRSAITPQYRSVSTHPGTTGPVTQIANRPPGTARSPVTVAPLQLAAPAASQPSTGQPMPSSLAPVTARTTHPTPQPRTQARGHAPNGTTQVGPVGNAPAQLVPNSSRMSPLQSTSMISLSTTATAPSHAARRDWPRIHQIPQPALPTQQRRPGNNRAAQNLHRQRQTPMDPRVAAQNSQSPVAHREQRALLLLPQPGIPPVQSTRPNPNRVALHQAFLRDPVNRLITRDATVEKETELLPYLDSLVVPPTPLGIFECAFHWQFSVSKAVLERTPPIQPRGLGKRLLRTVVDGNLVYRLRCIRVDPSATEVSEDSWCNAETAWPSVIYIFVNERELFVRRKLHNGKDIPLDITPCLQEGLNRISVHFIRSSAETRNLTYAMAVETLTFSSFSQAKELAQTLSATESRAQICKRLATTPGDDDELRIVSDDLTVTLVDPFTARLFDVPVRSRFCEHPECFDHDTFLQTRTLKSGCHSLEADWKCPICRQDARPQNLIIDGFLAEVRAEIKLSNQCAVARALQVKTDGSWELKTDVDASTSEKGTPHAPTPTPGALPKRKSSALDNICNPTCQRPKFETTPLIPEGVEDLQTPPVIILD